MICDGNFPPSFCLNHCDVSCIASLIGKYGFQLSFSMDFEISRFRGNLYFDGIKAWEERNWIGKIIKINDVSFKVEKNIPRCVAINLKPNTDDNSLDLLKSLKKTYNHFDMGVYLTALDDGQVNIGDNVSVK